jgi:hypothetical protein
VYIESGPREQSLSECAALRNVCPQVRQDPCTLASRGDGQCLEDRFGPLLPASGVFGMEALRSHNTAAAQWRGHALRHCGGCGRHVEDAFAEMLIPWCQDCIMRSITVPSLPQNP